MSEDVKRIYEKIRCGEIPSRGRVIADYKHSSCYAREIPEDQTIQNFWFKRGIRKKMNVSEISDELSLPLTLQINNVDIPFGRESILTISPRDKGFNYIFMNTKDVEYVEKIKEIMKEEGYAHSPFL